MKNPKSRLKKILPRVAAWWSWTVVVAKFVKIALHYLGVNHKSWQRKSVDDDQSYLGPLTCEEERQVQVVSVFINWKNYLWERSDLHQFSIDKNVYALHHSTPAVELHPYWPENKSGQLRPGWLLWPLVSNRSSTFTRLLLEYFFQVQRWSYGEKPSFSPHRPKSQSSYKLEPWTASQHFQHLSDVPW